MTGTDAMTRAELIAALEKVEGPSRELDVQIGIALPWNRSYAHGHRASNVPGKIVAYYDTGSHGTYHAERYTASLDAAVALVERALPADDIADHQKSEIRLQFGDYGCNASVSRDTFNIERSYHGSSRAGPAIALVIALLRALEAQEAAHDDA